MPRKSEQTSAAAFPSPHARRVSRISSAKTFTRPGRAGAPPAPAALATATKTSSSVRREFSGSRAESKRRETAATEGFSARGGVAQRSPSRACLEINASRMWRRARCGRGGRGRGGQRREGRRLTDVRKRTAGRVPVGPPSRGFRRWVRTRTTCHENPPAGLQGNCHPRVCHLKARADVSACPGKRHAPWFEVETGFHQRRARKRRREQGGRGNHVRELPVAHTRANRKQTSRSRSVMQR